MKKKIAIIGSGPAALLLAAMLNEKVYDISIYERNFAPGRKFLVAGDGGFNLTHSENFVQLITRYTPCTFLEKSLHSFTNTDLRSWLKGIGIDTYIGTSKRVFPVKGIKPIDVLNVLLNELKNKHIQLKTQHTWQGWNNCNELIIRHHDKESFIKADVVVFALGGASWPKTGSDGSWTHLFKRKNIETVGFQASNCAYQIKWTEQFLQEAEGKYLKNISIFCDNKEKKGEVVITRSGMEGGAVYALSPQIRKQLNEHDTATIFIDLKPAFTLQEIKKKLADKGNNAYTALLKDRLHCTEVQIALLKTILTKEEFTNTELLAHKIKQLPMQITAMAPIAEAISTVGGIALHEVDEDFQLKKLPDHYVIGEMLDWDAPTGGYLLQACFSMGYYLAKQLNLK